MKNLIIIFILAMLSAPRTSAQVMTTFAGIPGAIGFSGDGGPAGNAVFNGPVVGAIDKKGNVYIADDGNERIRLVNTNGIITTFAGTGATGYGGDGGSATAAEFNGLGGVVIDRNDFIYLSDAYNARIRRIDTAGIITTFAGNGVTFGYSGDGGPATRATLYFPTALTFDSRGNLYFLDGSHIRKVDTNGIISTVAGNGTTLLYSGDGGPALDAGLDNVGGIAVDTIGNMYISEQVECTVRVVDTFGIINVFAGPGLLPIGVYPNGFSGDDGPALEARLSGPAGLALDKQQNLYICDDWNQVIRVVNTSGIINTVAGTDTVRGYGGDGGPATKALLFYPYTVMVDTIGDIYISDDNYTVRKVVINGVAAVNNINSASPIAIFPNPVTPNDLLKINNVQGCSTFTMYSIIGDALQQGTLQQGSNAISLGSLPPGVYLLEITAADGTKTVNRIIKQ